MPTPRSYVGIKPLTFKIVSFKGYCPIDEAQTGSTETALTLAARMLANETDDIDRVLIIDDLKLVFTLERHR